MSQYQHFPQSFTACIFTWFIWEEKTKKEDYLQSNALLWQVLRLYNRARTPKFLSNFFFLFYDKSLSINNLWKVLLRSYLYMYTAKREQVKKKNKLKVSFFSTKEKKNDQWFFLFLQCICKKNGVAINRRRFWGL